MIAMYQNVINIQQLEDVKNKSYHSMMFDVVHIYRYNKAHRSFSLQITAKHTCTCI